MEDQFEAGRQDALLKLEKRIDRQITFLETYQPEAPNAVYSAEHVQGQKFMLDYLKQNIALEKEFTERNKRQGDAGPSIVHEYIVWIIVILLTITLIIVTVKTIV